ncbi:MAG: GNAT family N-acetyltransferase [Cognatishimia sp.]
MPVHITRAAESQAAEILVLQRLAYQSEAELYDDWKLPPLTQTLPEITAEFANQHFLIARRGSEIIGSVRAAMQGNLCRIGRLIVHPDYQRQGIGRALMCAIETAHSIASIFEVFTGHKSIANIAHYQSHGYKVSGRVSVSDKVTIVTLQKLHT